jgi:uncharacterized protein
MDGRKVVAYLCRSKKAEWQVTSENIKVILNFLARENIRILPGLDLAAVIPGILANEDMVCVAQGTEPVDGTDATIHCLFETNPAETQWMMDESNQVDFRTRNEVTNVKENDLLAEIIPCSPPKNGVDIFGKVLPAREGKKTRLIAGTNVKLSADEQKAYSKMDGCAKIHRGRVTVDRVLTVEGDVDFHSGNVRFNGDVVIRGDVKESFSVEAEGSTRIQGSVDRAIIKAGMDILVNGGIYSKDEVQAEAGGDISIGFAENANLKADGNIYIRSALINCRTYTEQMVFFKAMGTSLVGGHTIAVHGIEANCLGNPRVGTKTIVEFGPRPELSQKIRALTVEADMADEKRRKEIEKERAPLQAMFDEQSQATVTVKCVTYPGVVVKCGSATMDVRTELAEVVYAKGEGKNEIVMRPYVPEPKKRRAR